jgi:hypothetical protein
MNGLPSIPDTATEEVDNEKYKPLSGTIKGGTPQKSYGL